MSKLKQVIESTLINNLEVNNPNKLSFIDLDSIQTCSDYISQEMMESHIAFAKFTKGKSFDLMVPLAQEDQFNQFIEDRYKEQ